VTSLTASDVSNARVSVTWFRDLGPVPGSFRTVNDLLALPQQLFVEIKSTCKKWIGAEKEG